MPSGVELEPLPSGVELEPLPSGVELSRWSRQVLYGHAGPFRVASPITCLLDALGFQVKKGFFSIFWRIFFSFFSFSS
jgi:hypothetical protein